MQSLKKIASPLGEGFFGMTNVCVSRSSDSAYHLSVTAAQVLESLTNGIMRDDRVFHIDNQDWISQYNDQSPSCRCL